MKRLTLSLLVMVIVAIALVAGTSMNITGTSKNRVNAAARKQPADTIDGAKNPEKIPDHVAYSLLFDLIAGRPTEAEKNRIRSYIRQMGLEGADVDALIAAAEEYYNRESVLGQQADEIKARTHPNHSPLASQEKQELKRLQKRQEGIANEIAASLQYRLSADGLAKVRQHIKERVKRKTRMTVEPEGS